MAVKLDELRQDPRGMLRKLPERSYGELRYVEVFSWHGREYAMIGKLDLTPALQRLAVIDITSMDTTDETDAAELEIFERIRPARLNVRQPELETHSDAWREEGEPLADFQQRTRRHVLILFPDEGHTSILDNSGEWRWCRLADLPVRLVPGSSEDYREVRSQQMDELEQHVDAGGAIDL